MSATITNYQKELIERLGVFYEQSGIPPVTARVLALMLVADNTCLSFADIQEHLNISKSSTSSALNMLLTTKHIEYITRPGDRKRYFRSCLENWEREMQLKIEGLASMSTLYKEVLAQRPPQTGEFNQALRELSDFLDFFKNEIPGMFERWNAHKKQKQSEDSQLQ